MYSAKCSTKFQSRADSVAQKSMGRDAGMRRVVNKKQADVSPAFLFLADVFVNLLFKQSE